MNRAWLAPLLVGFGCTPTVGLGSNEVVGTGSTGDAQSDGLESSEASTGSSGLGSSDATGGADGASETGEGSTSTTAGGQTGAESEDEGNESICGDAPESATECYSCAMDACCLELDFCAQQPECTCLSECLAAGGLLVDCERCSASSGAAAVRTCLADACAEPCEPEAGESESEAGSEGDSAAESESTG